MGPPSGRSGESHERRGRRMEKEGGEKRMERLIIIKTGKKGKKNNYLSRSNTDRNFSLGSQTFSPPTTPKGSSR